MTKPKSARDVNKSQFQRRWSHTQTTTQVFKLTVYSLSFCGRYDCAGFSIELPLRSTSVIECCCADTFSSTTAMANLYDLQRLQQMWHPPRDC